MTDASKVDSRFAGDFPDSHRIVANDVLEVSVIEKFVSKDKALDGVKLTLKDGTFAHTTAKQPVGYILSPKLNLNAVISKAPDKAVNLYFTEEQSNTNSPRPMLKCSIYGNRG